MGNSQSHTSKPFTLKHEELYAKFEDDWFAQGASRYAYRGRMKPTRWWSFKRGEQCVVKLYKEEYCPILKEDAWKADSRASAKALVMAGLFNSEYTEKSPATIEILIPIISKVEKFASQKQLLRDPVPKMVRGSTTEDTEKADVMVPKGASIAIEHFLPGEYVHFLSNSSYVAPKVVTLVPEAFAHYSYHASKGEVLVTDLQGVHNYKSFTFTDPAVHSTERHEEKFGYYGPTDLGIFGVIKFFQGHKCNRLCKGLLKPDMSKIPDYLKGDLEKAIEAIRARSNSTYTHALLKSGLTVERIKELHTSIAQALVHVDVQSKRYGLRDNLVNVLSTGT